MEAFQSRIARWPTQVARYAFRGQPLWAAKPEPPPAVAACGACGAPRCFELQLLPSLLHSLRPADAAEDGIGMDWATVVCFSCTQCCDRGEAGSYSREVAHVQEDEVAVALRARQPVHAPAAAEEVCEEEV